MTPQRPFSAALVLVRTAMARVWALRWPLLAIHAALLLAGSAMLTPLAGLAVQAAVRLSGEQALADMDIVRFALSPAGLVAGLAVAGLVAALATLEVATMMAADRDDRQGRAPSALRAVAFAARRAPRLAVFASLLLLRVGLIAAPFAIAAWLVVAPLLGEADINYYLTVRPPEALRAAALLALLALGLVVALAARLAAWSLAPGLVLFGEARPRRAFARSAESSRGRRAAIALGLALGAIVAATATAATLALAGAGVRLALSLAGDGGLAAISTAVLAGLALWLTAGALTGAAMIGALAAFLTRLHFEAGGAPGETAPTPLATRARRRALVALAVAVAAGAAVGGVALVNAAGRGDAVQVIAHRGAAGARPENTLAAFEHAIEVGADWIELDVQETADGAVVVIHDRDFMKLAGMPLQVHEATLAQLAAIDIGSHFSPDYADQRTPTLREALELARGRIRVLIELKHYGFAVRLEERVAEVVEALGMVDQVAVMSLDHASMARMRALRPDWRLGLLAASAVGDLTRLDADFLALRAAIVTDARLTQARRAGRPVLVWTVNDQLAMSATISRGAAGLITDEPALARQVLAERAQMGAAERLLLAAADLFGLPVAARSGRDDSP